MLKKKNRPPPFPRAGLVCTQKAKILPKSVPKIPDPNFSLAIHSASPPGAGDAGREEASPGLVRPNFLSLRVVPFVVVHLRATGTGLERSGQRRSTHPNLDCFPLPFSSAFGKRPSSVGFSTFLAARCPTDLIHPSILRLGGSVLGLGCPVPPCRLFGLPLPRPRTRPARGQSCRTTALLATAVAT